MLHSKSEYRLVGGNFLPFQGVRPMGSRPIELARPGARWVQACWWPSNDACTLVRGGRASEPAGVTMGAPGTRPGGTTDRRRCATCGTVLASDNTARMCGRCTREHRDQLDAPIPYDDEFFETEDFRAAFESRQIGRVFKAYRHHPRHLRMFGKALNQEVLGRWLGIAQPHVSKLEKNSRDLSVEDLQAYAAKLYLPQHKLWFLLPGTNPAIFYTSAKHDRATSANDTLELLANPLDWETQDETKRRTFLAQAAGAAATILTFVDDSRSSISTSVSSFDLETLEGLEQTTLGLRRAYRSAGALSLLGPSHGTLNLLTGMLPKCGRYQDRLVTAIGQTAGLIGIMLTLDLDDFSSGGHYLSIAARAGQQASNDELLAFILGARAFHAAYSGDPVGGRDYADSALSIAKRGISPLMHGWLSAVASEMHATEHNEAVCRSLLDDAQTYLESADRTQPWSGVGVFNSEKLAAYVGGNLMRLGRYRDAQQVLHDALNKLDTSLVKHRCTAYVDLAEAYAADDKVEEATDYAANALSIIASTRHAASLRRVERLSKSIQESNSKASRTLGEKLIELKAAW